MLDFYSCFSQSVCACVFEAVGDDELPAAALTFQLEIFKMNLCRLLEWLD